MKKLKTPSKAYAITTSVFWIVFIAMVVFNQILIGLFNLDAKGNIAGNTFPNFIGIFFVLGLFITLVLMFMYATILFINSKYASVNNYKAESGWAVTVFVFNLIFTIIFAAWFIINILFVVENAEGKPMLENIALVEFTRKNGDKVFTIYISNIINWLAVFGVFSVILAFSLSIAISQRTSNVAKKIKEYERVNIY